MDFSQGVPKNAYPLFKSESIEDYQRFRSAMQALDLCLLELAHSKFDKREIIAACIFFQIGLFYNVFTRQQIALTPDISTLLCALE
jgi:hypothetical protein